MPIPRFTWKQLVSDIPVSTSRSYTVGTIVPAATFDSEEFNVQIMCLLNPFAVVTPANLVQLAAGHVFYWFVSYAGATTASVTARARFAPGAALFDITGTGTPIALAAAGAYAGRIDILGAVWDGLIRVTNTGAANMTSVEVAVAVRPT